MSMLSLIGIADAFAADAAPSTSQNIMSFLPLLVLLVLFMYFMVIRPQAKRSKEQKNLLGSLQKGDEIVTVGGVLGRIEKIAENFIVVSIAEGVNIHIQKNAVGNCLPKGTIDSIAK
jgi:preprotein translocase subunit YajC